MYTQVERWSLRDAAADVVRPRLLHWDGRLDNQIDLQTALGRPLGRDRRDRELALAAYERWDIEGLGRIIGDWSLVLCDARRHALVLASDYAGVRPLYLCRQAEDILWSTSLAALVDAAGAEVIDEEYVGGLLTGAPRPNRTPYAGVLSVPAGHAVILTAEASTLRGFWTMPVSDLIRFTDERRYDEQFRALFREAVAVRLQTHTPVLAELSGGIDSSSVVCMASQLIRAGEVPAPQLQTVSYVHDESLDLPFIREVERFCAIDGVHLGTRDYPLCPDGGLRHGMPQMWGPLLAAEASVAERVGATVFLTGKNGDLATGNWFDDSLQVAAPLRSGQIGRAVTDAFAWSKKLRIPIAWILWRALRASLPIARPAARFYELDAGSAPRSQETSLQAEFAHRIAVDGERPAESTTWMRAPPERRRVFRLLTMLTEQRALQAFEPVQHLDWTHPFAHRPLVEFMTSLPPNVLCTPEQPRRLMRRALGDLWPAALRARRSKDLLRVQWSEVLRPLAIGLLATPRWRVVERGWIDRTQFSSRLERFMHGLDCNERQLREIIRLEYWLRDLEEQEQAGLSPQTAC